MKQHRPPLFFADTRGASAVEFAIIMPVFLVLLIGIFAYGSYFALLHGLQQLTAEAARASIGGLTDDERQSLAQSSIATNVEKYPFLTAHDLTLAGAATDPATSTFSVTVSYDASGMFIFNLPNFIPMPSPTIIRTAAIQRGGY
ncbi:MAG TPA: TadE/TadG family type IV pilus assembly protein [Pseudolabrys sp.]|nr:TadE/TadG family type IV pilus assembly protein [Pseudolabrys sp.]